MHAMATNYCLLHFFPSHCDVPFPSTVCISLEGHESYISSTVWQKAYFSNSTFSPVAACTFIGLPFNYKCHPKYSCSLFFATAKKYVISYPFFYTVILFPAMPLSARRYSFNWESRHRSTLVLNNVRTFHVPEIFSFSLQPESHVTFEPFSSYTVTISPKVMSWSRGVNKHGGVSVTSLICKWTT